MNKKYITPATFVTEVFEEKQLLAHSDVLTTRHDSGDPTKDGLPTDIYNVSDTPDPYGNRGQDGNTNRGKELDLWGFDSFDLWN